MDFVRCNIGAGVRLHLCETEKFKSVTCKIFIQQDLDEKRVAATAVVPFLLRRGSQRFPSTQQLARELEYLYAAEFSSDVLKVGERQILELFFQIVDPSLLPNGEQNMERGMRTFWDIATNPAGSGSAFAEDSFTQEKRNLQEDLKGLINNKRSYAQIRALASMCAGEPFGIYKYGDLLSVSELDNEQVYKNYRRLWRDYPVDIFLVGPNLDVLANLIGQLIGERGLQKHLTMPEPVAVAEPRFVQESLDVQQAVLVMGFRTNCTYLDPDYYSLVVGNGILGGFPHSRLFLNVREQASLAYYVGSHLESTKGILMINAGIDGNKYEQSIEIIRQQLADLQQGSINSEELEQTKKSLVSSIAAVRDNPGSFIDGKIIGLVNGDPRSDEEIIAAIREVSAADVAGALNNLVLDTTYLLRSEGKEEKNGGAN